jgi:alpha-tubulin suppressor-like RCC1 family protein
MRGSSIEEGPVKLNFEGPEVRGIASEGNFDLILDADGHLWGLGRVPASLIGTANANRIHTTPIRIPGEQWSTVRVTWQGFAGLKQDGALWNQPVTRLHDDYFRPPVRFGERTDWVAVSRDWDSVLALAKDGSICRFGTPDLGPELGLLAPTRSVTWSLNLLDASK